MNCPGCRQAMREVTVDALLGSAMDVSVCPRCHAFWFEPFETVHLTPAATLILFGMMAELSHEPAPPLPPKCLCPVCESRLVRTHDRQRNTRFEYLRCERGHGRFTRFAEFLKEKDFVRALSAKEMGELRRTIRMVHCANCGAPVDLGTRSACEHCGSAISMLDMKKLAKVAGDVEPRAPAAGGPPRARPAPPRSRVSTLVAPGDRPRPDEIDLVGAGMRAVLEWIRTIVR